MPTFNTTFLVACFTVTLTVAFLPFAVLTVMVALPFPFATILPFLSTVATFLLEEDHVTVLSVVFVGFTVAFTVLDAPIEVKVTLLRSVLQNQLLLLKQLLRLLLSCRLLS